MALRVHPGDFPFRPGDHGRRLHDTPRGLDLLTVPGREASICAECLDLAIEIINEG